MTALCHRCKIRQIQVCHLADARSNAEFLGMCEPCYQEWLGRFPSRGDSAGVPDA